MVLKVTFPPPLSSLGPLTWAYMRHACVDIGYAAKGGLELHDCPGGWVMDRKYTWAAIYGYDYRKDADEARQWAHPHDEWEKGKKI